MNETLKEDNMARQVTDHCSPEPQLERQTYYVLISASGIF